MGQVHLQGLSASFANTKNWKAIAFLALLLIYPDRHISPFLWKLKEIDRVLFNPCSSQQQSCWLECVLEWITKCTH